MNTKITDNVDYSIDWDKYSVAINTSPASNKELEDAMKLLRIRLEKNKGSLFEGVTCLKLRKEVANELRNKLIAAGADSGLVMLEDIDPENNFVEEMNCFVKQLIVARNKMKLDMMHKHVADW